jgi:hypothetical protein
VSEANAVTVTYTTHADANLDGQADLSDLNVWKANFGLSNRIWTQADFNYDGAVSLGDLNIWKSSFGVLPYSAPPQVMLIARLGAECPCCRAYVAACSRPGSKRCFVKSSKPSMSAASSRG